MSARQRYLGLAVWLLLLALAGWYVANNLRIGADLRLFLPEPHTTEQKLLLEEIGEGPASRLLMVALSGAKPQALADLSNALASELRRGDQFRWVANGQAATEDFPEQFWTYRFLLTSTFDTQRLDESFLQSQLEQRMQDLSSPAASFIEPMLPRDPSLELLQLVSRWQPAQEPSRQFDVWFTRKGDAALLLMETRAAAFDPQGQNTAITALRAAFDQARDQAPVKMEVSGPGAFSVLMQARTTNEGQRFGTFATVAMILLTLLAYRSVNSVILSSLPLASAAIVGLVVVSALFGTVHGITLAFGFTLIGVAQDYPIHLLSHQHAGASPLHSARTLWPTLATGVASTCIAYLSFLFSGVNGLAQLATFTIGGLLVAGLTTRYLLPRLMAPHPRDVASLPWLMHVQNFFEKLAVPKWLGIVALLAIVLVWWLMPGPLWRDSLSGLTPVPHELLLRDQALRQELGTADIRYVLTVSSHDSEQLLEQLEALDPKLEALRASGAITAYDHAARYLPSIKTQKLRQSRLPDAATLHTDLTKAVDATAFNPMFEPFEKDVANARTATPLTLHSLEGTPLASRLESLLLERGDTATALITLTGIKQPEALERFANSAGPNVHWLDLKGATEELVKQQRIHILHSLALAGISLIVVVGVALRSLSRVLRVLAPMALTTALIVTVLHASGVQLNLFHLISLVLAAGLGLDYALFFEHASADAADQRRTVHALVICSVSTLMVFALLALSSMPVLQAIGVTVSLGVVSNFVLAFILTRPSQPT